MEAACLVHHEHGLSGTGAPFHRLVSLTFAELWDPWKKAANVCGPMCHTNPATITHLPEHLHVLQTKLIPFLNRSVAKQEVMKSLCDTFDCAGHILDASHPSAEQLGCWEM